MRYRDYKIFRQGNYYHVYNRGVNKQDIFLEPQDYFNFLKRLKIVLGIKETGIALGSGSPSRIKPLPVNAFTILSYCLMSNHLHLLIQQNTDLGIDKLMLKICTSYAIYFNNKYHRIGPLFQDSFKAKLVEQDSYLTYLSAYIHNNPSNPLYYDFSSFKDYLHLRSDQLCSTDFILKMFDNNVQKYKQFVIAFNHQQEINIGELLFGED